MAGVYGGFTSSAEFIDGAQMDFIPSYCLRIPKTLIFAMLPYHSLSWLLHEMVL
jgi:phospholipid/cholesterol/gamma-HCH transport system permease protein